MSAARLGCSVSPIRTPHGPHTSLPYATDMNRVLRDGSGALLILVGMGALWGVVLDVEGHDYVAAMLWATVGMGLVRAAVALLRPSMGE